LKRIILLAVIAVAVIVSIFYCQKIVIPSKPALPANVREALGIRATLKSIKRVSNNAVIVKLFVENRRRDKNSVFISSDSVRIGHPRWPIPVLSSSGSMTGTTYEYTCQIPASIRSTFVTYDVELERKYLPRMIKFNTADTSHLPVTKKIDGAETTILWARMNPPINRSLWDDETTVNGWAPGKRKYFALLLQTQFEKGQYYSTCIDCVKDEHGKELVYLACYTKNNSTLRKLNACGAELDVMISKNNSEKVLNKISPVVGEAANDWRAERAKRNELRKPLRQETILCLFAADTSPKRFDLKMNYERENESVDKASLSFGNVAIR